jgi:hypothetical protein
MLLTPHHQAKYIAHDLTLQHACGGIARLSQALFNASVDLSPLKTLSDHGAHGSALVTPIRKSPGRLVYAF